MSTEYLIPENFLKEIEKFFTKDKKALSFPRFKKYASHEFKKWLEERIIPVKFLAYIYKNHLRKITIPNCPICGKKLSFHQIMNECVFCSVKCMAHSKEIKEKKTQTTLKHYGVENISQSENIKERKRETYLARYGVENISQVKEIQEKKTKTNLEKYGVVHYSKTKEYKKNCKETCLKKYGVEYSSQSKNFRENHRCDFWNTFCLRLKEKDINPLFTKEEYMNDTGRLFKCLQCGRKFKSDGSIVSEKNRKMRTQHIYCPYCFKSPFSKKEKEVLEYVKSIYQGEILENNRKQLEGKELDIFLPSLNLGIEFDGTYWHSKKGAKENDKKKNRLCEQKGITLIRIKESEWDNAPETVKQKLRKLLQNAIVGNVEQPLTQIQSNLD